jgi:hypothetical protein
MSGEPIDLTEVENARLRERVTALEAVVKVADLRAARVRDAMPHKAPEHLWDCPCCRKVRGALRGES